jgi:hypothetical protein
MRYRRRAAVVIALVTLLCIAMEFSEELLPGLAEVTAEGPGLRPTVTSILALVYAGLIAFKKSLIFKPTTKTWKRLLLAALAVVGLILILVNGFTVPYIGFVLSGLTFAACLLWFDSDARETQDAEETLPAR